MRDHVSLGSGGSRPSDKGGGGWSSRPWDKGGPGLKKNFFSALRASFWSKNKGGGRAPRPLLWIRHCSKTEYKCQLESVQLSYKVRLLKGALSRWSTFFCWQSQSRVFIRYGTWDVTCELQNHVLVWNKYVSQALYQMIKITKMNFWKTAELTNFKKRQLQSVSVFFKFVHPFLLLHLLCYFYLLFMFWAVILMFHLVWWRFPQIWIVINLVAQLL